MCERVRESEGRDGSEGERGEVRYLFRSTALSMSLLVPLAEGPEGRSCGCGCGCGSEEGVERVRVSERERER